MEMGKKIPFFFPPLIFFTSFSVTSWKKTGLGGKILYCFSKKEGKMNTIQHGQGEKHRHRRKTLTQRERIFPPVHRL
jgi:hypothetical protein